MASKVVSCLEHTSSGKLTGVCSCSLCLGSPESVTPASSQIQPFHFPVLNSQERESESSLFTVAVPAELICLLAYLSLGGWPGSGYRGSS